MKVYIACKMTGEQNYNRDKIRAVAKIVKQSGYEPVHGADLPDDWEYMDYIKHGLKQLIDCNLMLIIGDDWEESKGITKYELPLAKVLDIEIEYMNESFIDSIIEKFAKD